MQVDAKEELINEEREEARAEGRAEDRIEGLQSSIDMILELLSDIADELSTDLKERIRKENDPDILKEYFRKARKASSIAEFEDWINEI